MMTIAICTWNRALLLRKTLQSLQSLIAETKSPWELVVVNNNSTDETDCVLAEFERCLPLRRIHEPRQGHCFARNAAIEAARGELILWTDDDVLVARDWILQYEKAARDYPDAAFFGGTVDPWFETDPPAWICSNLDQLQGVYAIRQLGSDIRWLRESEQIFGANMAFRTEVLRKNLFNTQIGLQGAVQIRGDEVELTSRLRSQGMRGVWVGQAKVKHFVPSSRLNLNYIQEYFSGIGRTDYRLSGQSNVPMLLGAPRWAYKKWAAKAVQKWALAPTRSRAWLSAVSRSAYFHGFISEARRAKSARAKN